MIIGVIGVVLIGFLFIIMCFVEFQFLLFYFNFDFEDVGCIMQILDLVGIFYEVKGNGMMIFVFDDQVLKLCMDMVS